MRQSAIITATVAAASVTSPYFVDVDIKQQFCKKTCVYSVPVFAPAFSVVGLNSVGTNQYELVVNVQGSINYYPCQSATSTVVPINQNFVVPIYSATAITASDVSIASGSAVNSMIRNGCKPCSSRFESKVPLAITVA